jgi:hypothetical protein
VVAETAIVTSLAMIFSRCDRALTISSSLLSARGARGRDLQFYSGVNTDCMLEMCNSYLAEVLVRRNAFSCRLCEVSMVVAIATATEKLAERCGARYLTSGHCDLY